MSHLKLNGYEEEWKAVNAVLPPPKPEEEPGTWRVPLTWIRAYIMNNVSLRKGNLSEMVAAYFQAGSTPDLASLLDRLDCLEVMHAFRRGLEVNRYTSMAATFFDRDSLT